LVTVDPELRGYMAARSGFSDMSDRAVEQRLAQHSKDVRRALANGSKYGTAIDRLLKDSTRNEAPELHRKRHREARSSLTTGGGTTASASGGGAAAFVAPAFLMDQWAAYRSPYRAFADQCNSTVPLPEFGLEVYLPTVTSGSSVTTQTEASGVSEGDPVATFASSPIVTKAGQITVSQQFLDRAGSGISGDRVLFQQIQEQLHAQVDSYAIAQAIASAATVTNSSAFALTTASGVGGFVGDLKKAKSKLTDTAGVRLRGTHLFTTGDFADYVQAYADAQGRPVFSPCLDDNQLPLRAQGDPNGEGWTGYVIAGLAHFADDNILPSGSNTQLIVCRPSTILQLEGAPIPYLFTPTQAQSLEAVLGVRCYVATLARYASGVATISGSAYAASTFA
jgi:hypothetical protein